MLRFAAMSPAPSPSPEAALRAAGLKITRGRRLVWQALLRAERPLSHADLERQLDHNGDGGLDRVTLYRILDALVAAGLAGKAADRWNISRYAARTPDRPHADHLHFRCTACGGTFCLKMPLPSPPPLPRGFLLTGAEYDLSGYCPGCAPSTAGAHRR